jgi:hypothetical protein
MTSTWSSALSRRARFSPTIVIVSVAAPSASAGRLTRKYR